MEVCDVYVLKFKEKLNWHFTVSDVYHKIVLKMLRTVVYIAWANSVSYEKGSNRRECLLNFLERVKGKAIAVQVQRVLGGWDSQISRHSTHEGSKVVNSTHWAPLPQKIFLVLISFRGGVDPRALVRSEGLCRWKFQQYHHQESNPLPSGL